jgi:hypothetical protein
MTESPIEKAAREYADDTKKSHDFGGMVHAGVALGHVNVAFKSGASHILAEALPLMREAFESDCLRSNLDKRFKAFLEKWGAR